MRRILVAVQYFHEDKLSGFRRPAAFLKGNSAWKFVVPSHRTDGEWARNDGPWRPVEALHVRAPAAGRRRFTLNLRYFREFWRCLRSAEPPVSAVYMVSPPAWWVLPAAFLARFTGVPAVLDLGDPEGSLRPGFGGVLGGLCEKIARRLSSRVVVASPDMVRARDTVAYTGVGEEFFNVGRERFERGASPDRSAIRIVYAGTFDELRPLGDFLEAWRQFVKGSPQSVLVLAGRGRRDEDEKELRDRVESLGILRNVRFRGLVPPVEVPALLAEADWGLVSLNPDRDLDYAVPTKLMEYFAAGLPVLAVGGERVRRIIEESGGGAWLDPKRLREKDAGAPLSSIFRLDASAPSAHAFRYAVSRYTRDRYQATVNQVLSECARPWSRAVERGFRWLESEALVGEPDLPPGRLAVRLAVVPSHIPGADRLAYLEISAYAAVLYLERYLLEQEDETLERAAALGHWLIDCQMDSGSIPFAYMLDRREFLGPCFAFDTAMAVHAWLLLDRMVPDSAWRDAASRAGRWLANRMQREDGAFIAAEDTVPGPMPEPAPPCYYGSGAALHLKIALALKDLADAFPGDPVDYRDAHARLIAWGGRLQQEGGSFPLGSGTKTVNTHTHSYALEGSLSHPGGGDMVRRGLQWSLSALRDSGWLPETSGESGPVRNATDATAQTLRLLAMTARTDSSVSVEFQDAAQRIARSLRKAQCRSGGWPAETWRSRPGPPVWPTLLALSALLYWERDDLDPEFLF